MDTDEWIVSSDIHIQDVQNFQGLLQMWEARNTYKTPVPFYFRSGPGVSPHNPSSYILLTNHLIQKARLYERELGHQLTASDFLQLGVKEKEGAVYDEFNTMALNSINALFYSSCSEAFTNSHLARFFTHDEKLQQTLGMYIKRIKPQQSIRIKEIMCGSEIRYRWNIISHVLREKNLQVLLYDFSNNTIPNRNVYLTGLKEHVFEYGMYNTLDPFPLLEEEHKVDIMLTTYGFDSIWFPEDVQYKKIGDDWYKVLYRVKVHGGVPQAHHMQEALQRGSDDTILVHHLEHLAIERMLKQIDILNEPYGKSINDMYSHISRANVSMPGGLIAKVKEAFDTQIREDGVFIIGDVAYDSRAAYEVLAKKRKMSDFYRTGSVALYKIEDYGLAAHILGTLGYGVDLYDLNTFYELNNQSYLDSSYNQYIMVVKKHL